MTIPDIQPSSWLTYVFSGITPNATLRLVQGGRQVAQLSTPGFSPVTAQLNSYYGSGRAVRYGPTSILVNGQDGLYSSTDNGATFTKIHSFTGGTPATALAGTGIYVLHNGANMVFCGAFGTTAPNLNSWTWNPDTDGFAIFGPSGPNLLDVTDMYFQDQCLIGNQIFWPAWTLATFIAVSPLTGVHTEFGVTGLQTGAQSRTSSCVVKDDILYLLYPHTVGPGAGTWDIGIWDGASGWTNFGLLMDGPSGLGQSLAPTAGLDNNSRCFIDPESGNLIAIFEDRPTTFYGFACNRVNLTTQTAFDITASVLPASLISVDSGGSSAHVTAGGGRSNVRIFYDTQSSPGNIGIFLYFGHTVSNATRAGHSVYQWKGINDPLRFVGYSNITKDSVFSESAQGGGGFTFAEGTKFTRITDRDPAGPYQQLSFRPFGGGTVDLEFRFARKMGTPTTQCNLVNTPSQGTLNGNILEGVTADGAIKTVNWNAASQFVGSEEPNVVVVVGEV